ncbi:hypothetical protein [Niveispirillum sp.]|uniref:hypothetical protein n=1 Tax=Niveispirillum sp. TaxID=1917217 RepID=UPI001B4B3244|nr:hypothetical protein [Niveispirillum sp.]MBP7339092.1 hypothetical protein [Niveispirillum sp.]
MAKIGKARRDTARIKEGEWRRLFLDSDPEKDGKILTKGYTDAYRDAVADRVRLAAEIYNGDRSKMPVSASRHIDIDMHCTHLFLDVSNVQGDDGKDLTFTQFCDVLRDPDYLELWHLAQAATASVGRRAEADRESAEKN